MSCCSSAPRSTRTRLRTSSRSMSASPRASARRRAAPPPAGSGSIASRPSSPSRRRATATARSSPARTSGRASAWASSWRRSAGVSATAADDRSPKPRVPSSWRTTRSRSRRWWAIPASWRRRRSCHRSSRASSVSSAGSSSPTGRPSGRTTTRASPCPALPAVTRCGTRTPARSASSVTNPSCSTSSMRLSRAVRWPPRYHARRQSVGQQLGVPRVAAVHLDVDAAVGVVAGEADDALRRASGAAGPDRRRRRPARAAPARSASSSGARRASRRRGARRPPPGGRPDRGRGCRRRWRAPSITAPTNWPAGATARGAGTGG